MKKSIFCSLLIFFVSLMTYAGDAAVFSDIGFSEDGTVYLFGQYGKTDKTYQAWAEIYSVDVAKNSYVKDGVFKTSPSAATTTVSGKKAYEDLSQKTSWRVNSFRTVPVKPDNLLYVRESEEKDPTQLIVFKDFEASTAGKTYFYHVRLVPTYEGSGQNVQSKYYINLEKIDGEGNLLFSRRVGTPDYKRKGISGYRIERIFTDRTGKSMVFVVEKTLQDETGTSIRYMVETVRL